MGAACRAGLRPAACRGVAVLFLADCKPPLAYGTVSLGAVVGHSCAFFVSSAAKLGRCAHSLSGWGRRPWHVMKRCCGQSVAQREVKKNV